MVVSSKIDWLVFSYTYFNAQTFSLIKNDETKCKQIIINFHWSDVRCGKIQIFDLLRLHSGQ